MAPRRRVGTTRLTTLLLAVACFCAGTASAAVPFKDIASGGPLTSIALGNELSCQVAHSGDTKFELFPSSFKPGDCGTFIALGGVLYAPNFAQHDTSSTSSIGTYTPFVPVAQSGPAGAGTGASPFKVTTVADTAAGLRVTQVDAYVAGQESYRTDTTLTNITGGPLAGTLYRAGDCYLQGNDTGFGFLDAAHAAVGCSVNANNSPAGRIEQWYPISGGNQYMEGRYSEVWSAIATQMAFPNTTRAAEALDNGAGISWNFAVPAGGSATYAHYTTFSPRGVAGPPTSVTPPGTIFGPNGALSVPSNRHCISKRYFKITLRKKYWPVFVGVTIKMPKTTKVLNRKPWATYVDLRGLPRGKFTVRIAALTTAAKTLRGKRTYRTCRGRLTGGKRPL
jgi:hypothetical protein